MKTESTWYVLGSVSRNQELKIRDEFRRESFNCFVPLRYVVRTRRGVRKRELVPAIPGLIFIQGSEETLKEAISGRKHGLYLRKSTFTNKEEYLTVPDHDMQNFIAVSEQAGEHITYFSAEEIRLRPGDKIRINGGMFDGREGVIMRVKGKRKRQFIVSLPNVVYAAVELEPELVELAGISTSEKVKQESSKNVDKDKKLLFDLAKRLLFEIPTTYQQEKEYYILFSELRRAAERLQPIKAYLPAQEVELALALYLAAIKMEQNIAPAEQRLRVAVSKLQDSSLLKLRAQIFLAKFSGDETIRQMVEGRIVSWKQGKLSENQKAFIKEFNLVFSKV